MNTRDKFFANERKLDILAENQFCQHCKRKPSQQLAHRIAKTKLNYKMLRKRYPNVDADYIMNHKYNLVPVCGLECNSKFNIGNNQGKVSVLVYLICVSSDLTHTEITGIINDESVIY